LVCHIVAFINVTLRRFDFIRSSSGTYLYMHCIAFLLHRFKTSSSDYWISLKLVKFVTLFNWYSVFPALVVYSGCVACEVCIQGDVTLYYFHEWLRMVTERLLEPSPLYFPRDHYRKSTGWSSHVTKVRVMNTIRWEYLAIRKNTFLTT
jgi:hypothetical protein